ncbi:MAG TPA: hypothetical protein VHU91_04935 [Mycobacteriales bacterium]|nr:hypothetical protein [Mycobacteriales bacterium]
MAYYSITDLDSTRPREWRQVWPQGAEIFVGAIAPHLALGGDSLSYTAQSLTRAVYAVANPAEDSSLMRPRGRLDRRSHSNVGWLMPVRERSRLALEEARSRDRSYLATPQGRQEELAWPARRCGRSPRPR